MSHAHPPDPDLVAERVARLTTDTQVTRRGYLKILGVLGGLAAGNVAVALGAFQRRTVGATTETVIPTTPTRYRSAVQCGSPIRTSATRRCCYGSTTTPTCVLGHLHPPGVRGAVAQRHDRLHCPCHDGVFDPADGAPVAGPPERPLPRLALEHRDNAIVAVGEAVPVSGAE